MKKTPILLLEDALVQSRLCTDVVRVKLDSEYYLVCVNNARGITYEDTIKIRALLATYFPNAPAPAARWPHHCSFVLETAWELSPSPKSVNRGSMGNMHALRIHSARRSPRKH